MNLNLRWRVFIALASIVVSVFILWPTWRYYGLSPEQRTKVDPAQLNQWKAKALRLGLDLQGGMHMVLDLDTSKLQEGADIGDITNRALEIVRNRVDEFGVSEPVIQKAGDRRIIVELAGIEDMERAQQIVSKAAVLEFKMVRPGSDFRRLLERMDAELARRAGVQASAADTSDEAEADSAAAKAEARKAGAKPAAAPAAGTPATAAAESSAAKADSTVLADKGGLLAWMPEDIKESGGRPLASRISIVPRGGKIATNELAFVHEEDYERVAAYLKWVAESTRVIPDDVQWSWGADTAPDPQTGERDRYVYLLNTRAELTGEVLQNARPQPDNSSSIGGNYLVGFDLDREGRRLFARTTGENVGRLMAIVLDGRVKSAPEIQEKIRGGGASITGRFSAQEAADLALVLRAGALPAPLVIEEQRAVGPSLGRDSIQLGTRAILYGFLLVLVFMVMYYRVAGGIAIAALFINLVIMLALLVSLGAVLTMPGIAGFVLTVGMSVDANVLIYERIREELRWGQTFRNALSRGYDKVFLTIFDSHVTTLCSALALLWFGTGPIKGFAISLSLGIIVSLYTALFVTRIIFDLLMRRAGVRDIPI
ncbi:MAG: protein translocase subunit SecD [bacterium]